MTTTGASDTLAQRFAPYTKVGAIPTKYIALSCVGLIEMDDCLD